MSATPQPSRDAVATGTTTGLALDQAALIALVTPGTVTKAAGSSAGSVDLSFSAASTAFDYLAKGEVLTLTYTVAIDDGDGGVTPKTFVVTVTGTDDAPVIANIAQQNLTEQTDTSALTTTIPVTFTDVDLTDVGHAATSPSAVATGTTTGLALDQAALIALVTPGAVTKNSGSSSGSVDTVVLRRFDGVRLSGQGRSADAHLHGGDRRWRRRRDVADLRRHRHRHE